MLDRFNSLLGKSKYMAALVLMPLMALICIAFSLTNTSDFDLAKREILLRKIGHELLLQSHDSTSRVLPVEKKSENEFEIRFEKELMFKPESLVKITQKILNKDAFASDYIVNVIKCGTETVTYGYAISENKKDDIITCKGREQPKACYVINIQFKPKKVAFTKNAALLGGLPVLAFVGLLLLRSGKSRKTLPGVVQNDVFNIGEVIFNAPLKQLIINNNTTDLTGTETRLLLIFASSPNQIIERSRLQKEIWEDEGVIVGRSLDMFISKLRKKLEPAGNVNIVVVRGKGYKLEVTG
ncbi:winged helix-turn-helix domain-containing protein [Mucilaginibacter auburnensis]|uniref:Transcriptional regulator n=1 Tax=Mucilaginibacter auburnensis TaxID=1457233 RepID=A0A2H9VU64_9SPHI|nr:winged helix-turn-helix domain-containing protein [Mucilaginibacter auburnensis]PJJ84339.1 transcriptional regulator [Mucilaginibacter auburnensis]